MSSRILLFFFVLIIPVQLSFSQTIRVLEAENNQALKNAVITDPKTQKIVLTDSLGYAVLSEYTDTRLKISCLGYLDKVVSLKEKDTVFYLEPDIFILEEIVIRGFENYRKIKETAGSAGLIRENDIDRFDDGSLVRAVNTIPGVRMEERSPMSYRLSIRGSLLRAPYGVRNIKTYWNDLPFTDPFGNTYLYFLDNSLINKMELTKGPSGSTFGSSMGGSMNLYTKNPDEPPLVRAGFSTGSFVSKKFYIEAYPAIKENKFRTNYAYQQLDGYREHTNSRRDVVYFGGQHTFSEKHTLSTHVLYSNLYYQLPGGLTKEQYDEDPRQARPASVQQNASIDHRNLRIGLVNDVKWKQTGNMTALYVSSGKKINPFITNYEIEKARSIGGRTRFYFENRLLGFQNRFTIGAEWNYGQLKATNFGNIGGIADTLRYKDDIRALDVMIFGQSELKIGNTWILDVGMSYSTLTYDINRIDDREMDTSYRVNRKFLPVVSPRIGLINVLNDAIAAHLSISTGFSPPVIDEIRTSDGIINRELEAEKGINVEAGIRGNLLNKRLNLDVSAFLMRQKNTIVSQITEGGSAVYQNSGSTIQPGVELQIGYTIPVGIKWKSCFVQTSFTYHDFWFQDYKKAKGSENVDYSSNQLTGSAKTISVTTFDIEHKNGFFLHVSGNLTGRIPLNDGNTIYSESYQLLTAKAGYEKAVNTSLKFRFYIGMDNILNEKYSLGNDLNAFGGRYYNPSPERNIYGGIRVSLFKKNETIVRCKHSTLKK